MANDKSDVNLELVLRVRDLAGPDLERLAKVAGEVAKEVVSIGGGAPKLDMLSRSAKTASKDMEAFWASALKANREGRSAFVDSSPIEQFTKESQKAISEAARLAHANAQAADGQRKLWESVVLYNKESQKTPEITGRVARSLEYLRKLGFDLGATLSTAAKTAAKDMDSLWASVLKVNQERSSFVDSSPIDQFNEDRRKAISQAASLAYANAQAAGAQKRLWESVVAFNKDGGRVPEIAERSARSFDRWSVSSFRLGTALGPLARRSLAFIGVDFATRVAGFNGVMDVFNTLMNKGADAVRGVLGLPPKLTKELDDQAESVSRLSKLYEDLREHRKKALEESGPLVVGGFDFTEAVDGLEGNKRLAAAQFLEGFDRTVTELREKYLREPSLLEQVLGITPKQGQAEFARARKEEFDRITDVLGVLRQSSKLTGDQITVLAKQVVDGKTTFEELSDSGDYTAETLRRLEVEIRRLTTAETEWKKRLASGAEIRARREAMQQMAETAGFLATNMLKVASAQLQLTLAEQERRADTAAEVARINAEFERRLALTKELIAAGKGFEKGADGQLLLPSDAAARAEAFANLADEIERARVESDLLRRAAEKRTQNDFLFGFKAGIGDVLGDLKNLNRFLGQQFAGGSFDALRTLFRDVATDAKKGSEAVKEFGRNFLTMIVDVFAQLASKQIVGGLLGGFGIDLDSLFGGSFEKGGIMPGVRLATLPIRQYAGGGIADSPQVAIYGEGKASQFGEAFVPLGGNRRIPVEMRGGGMGATNVELTLNVGSLDPRGATEIIMGSMDAIVSGVAKAVQLGKNRNAINAFRGVFA